MSELNYAINAARQLLQVLLARSERVPYSDFVAEMEALGFRLSLSNDALSLLGGRRAANGVLSLPKSLLEQARSAVPAGRA